MRKIFFPPFHKKELVLQESKAFPKLRSATSRTTDPLVALHGAISSFWSMAFLSLPMCQVLETTELKCPKFPTKRALLCQLLDLSANSATFRNMHDLAVTGKTACKHLVSFLLRTNNFNSKESSPWNLEYKS